MTTDAMLECPFCGGAVPQDVTICPSCQEDLSALIQLLSSHAIHYNEAVALARTGQLDHALIRAELAVSHKPDFAPAHVLLAKLHARQGAWTEALDSAQRALALTPNDARVRHLAEDIAGEAQRASERSQAADEAAPDSVSAAPDSVSTAPDSVSTAQDGTLAAPDSVSAAPERIAAAVPPPVPSAPLSSRALAERQLAMYERDVARAFGLGAAVVGGLALFGRLLFGRRHD